MSVSPSIWKLILVEQTHKHKKTWAQQELLFRERESLAATKRRRRERRLYGLAKLKVSTRRIHEYKYSTHIYMCAIRNRPSSFKSYSWGEPSFKSARSKWTAKLSQNSRCEENDFVFSNQKKEPDRKRSIFLLLLHHAEEAWRMQGLSESCPWLSPKKIKLFRVSQWP